MAWTNLFPFNDKWPLGPVGYQERVRFCIRRSKHGKPGMPKGMGWTPSSYGKARQVGPVPLAAPPRPGYHKRR